MLRGVENGFAIARSAQQGVLTVSDAYGRVLVEAASSVRPEALALTDVPGRQVWTLYTRAGNWFAWGSVVAFALLWIATVRSAR
jgi:apolipoprotein N-acyltransferase